MPREATSTTESTSLAGPLAPKLEVKAILPEVPRSSVGAFIKIALQLNFSIGHFDFPSNGSWSQELSLVNICL